MPVVWNPALRELDGQRQPDVSEPHDTGAGAARLNLLEQRDAASADMR
jgi:hypothetical protein